MEKSLKNATGPQVSEEFRNIGTPDSPDFEKNLCRIAADALGRHEYAPVLAEAVRITGNRFTSYSARCRLLEGILAQLATNLRQGKGTDGVPDSTSQKVLAVLADKEVDSPAPFDLSKVLSPEDEQKIRTECDKLRSAKKLADTNARWAPLAKFLEAGLEAVSRFTETHGTGITSYGSVRYDAINIPCYFPIMKFVENMDLLPAKPDGSPSEEEVELEKILAVLDFQLLGHRLVEINKPCRDFPRGYIDRTEIDETDYSGYAARVLALLSYGILNDIKAVISAAKVRSGPA